MNANDFVGVMLRDLHGGLLNDVDPLTQEQFVRQMSPGGNSVAFLLWHSTRLEDNLLRQQANQEPTWTSQRWFERLGLAPDDIGTGFSDDQVRDFQPAKDDLLAYVNGVWDAMPELLPSLTAERLDVAPNPERPRMTVGRSIANFVVGHGWLHLGEIRYIKGLMGMPFAR